MSLKTHCTITLSWLENHCLNSAHGQVDEVDPVNGDIILLIATSYSHVTHGLKESLYNYHDLVGDLLFEAERGQNP